MLDKHDYWETSREKEEREAKEKLDRARLVGVVEALGKSKDGTFFLKWVCEELAGCFSPAVALAAEGLLYREGRRSVGMQIFSLCREAGIAGAVCAVEDKE